MNPSTRSAGPSTHRDPHTWNEPCRRAVSILDKALALPPLELKSQVDDAETEAVRARDRLIDLLRAGRDAPQAEEWRSARDQVNAALSLIIGVEYPAVSIQHNALEQARDVLKKLIG